MDVNNVNLAQGTPLLVWPKNTHTGANQLWFNNDDGTLRSKLNQYAVDMPNAEPAQGKQLIVWPVNMPFRPTNCGSGRPGQRLCCNPQSASGLSARWQWGKQGPRDSGDRLPANNPISDNRLWRLVAAPTADCAAVATPTPVPPTPLPPPATPIQTSVQINSTPTAINVQCAASWNFTFVVLAADPSQGAPTGTLTLTCSPLGSCPLGFGGNTKALGPVTTSMNNFKTSAGVILTLTYLYTPADPTRFAPSSRTSTYAVTDEICVQ